MCPLPGSVSWGTGALDYSSTSWSSSERQWHPLRSVEIMLESELPENNKNLRQCQPSVRFENSGVTLFKRLSREFSFVFDFNLIAWYQHSQDSKPFCLKESENLWDIKLWLRERNYHFLPRHARAPRECRGFQQAIRVDPKLYSKRPTGAEWNKRIPVPVRGEETRWLEGLWLIPVTSWTIKYFWDNGDICWRRD